MPVLGAILFLFFLAAFIAYFKFALKVGAFGQHIKHDEE